MPARSQSSVEATLQQTEIIQTFFDYLPVMLGLYSPTGEILVINRELERVIGWSKDDYAAVDVLAECYPDAEVRAEVVRHIVAADGTWKDFKTRVRDGRVLDTSWAQIRLSNGNSIGIGQDITERKRLEEQLNQTHKMEAIGRLAGGVAHDFNNLLTVIKGRAEMARPRLSPSSPGYDDVQEIIEAADSAAHLTRQLLAFARRQVIAPKPVNLNEVVARVERMLGRIIGEDIELVVSAAPGLGAAKVDPGQFEQLLLNLAANARDAMPDGGRLVIETRNVVLDDDYAQGHAGVAPGPYVMLAVSDTGVGMSPELTARAFEPFLTTKEVGKGTGLGLATCYGIVKQHCGHIWIYSEVGHGTTFRIYLPGLDAAGAVGARDNTPAPAAPEGSETLLLVEDEPHVRALATEVLRDHGYTVLAAASGAEALELAQGHEAKIDLLLTDVVMPRMSGRQVAEQLQRARPGLLVLYMSGYTEFLVVQQGMLEPGISLIEKPFAPSALARKVREILDARHG